MDIKDIIEELKSILDRRHYDESYDYQIRQLIKKLESSDFNDWTKPKDNPIFSNPDGPRAKVTFGTESVLGI